MWDAQLDTDAAYQILFQPNQWFRKQFAQRDRTGQEDNRLRWKVKPHFVSSNMYVGRGLTSLPVSCISYSIFSKNMIQGYHYIWIYATIAYKYIWNIYKQTNGCF